MRFDFQLLNNDLVINRQGDFVIAPSDEQHIEDTINAGPDWWKQYPADGCNATTWLGGPQDTQAKAKLIQIQLTSDGYQVSNPTITASPDGSLVINPNATIS